MCPKAMEPRLMSVVRQIERRQVSAMTPAQYVAVAISKSSNRSIAMPSQLIGSPHCGYLCNGSGIVIMQTARITFAKSPPGTTVEAGN